MTKKAHLADSRNEFIVRQINHLRRKAQEHYQEAAHHTKRGKDLDAAARELEEVIEHGD